jgi:FkbM family methyltransferase
MKVDDPVGPAATFPPSCVVYGGGSFGQLLTRELGAAGCEVVAILDRELSGSYEKVPIRHPGNSRELKGYPAVLGICNPYTSPIEIAGYLRELGYQDILSPVHVFAELGRTGRQLDHYWLTSDVGLYTRESEEIARARALLADERSMQLFDSLLQYRTGGDIESLPEIKPSELQYLPGDVEFVDGPVALIDGGAYNGDTVRSYLAAGVRLEMVVAFEPDPANFAQLSTELAAHPELVGAGLPLALGRTTKVVPWTGNGASAAISESGDRKIQCVALDDALNGWPVTHIKLDIEGAEPDALAGMERLLKAARPRLAVCAYHRPEHLWTLLLQVDSLDLDYRFSLRCHGEQCFDTVLYAIPEL